MSHPLSPGLGRGGVPRPRQTLSGLPLMPGSPLGQAGLSKLVWGYLSGRNHGNLQPGNPSWWALPSSPVGFSTGLLPCLALSSYLLPGNLILLILEGEIPSPATPPPTLPHTPFSSNEDAWLSPLSRVWWQCVRWMGMWIGARKFSQSLNKGFSYLD